ncbi:MAG TPA: NIPSNAP family protein [Paracoccus sp. (in: a-proteobacteria)]|uniref:NIPSNAP family protein n=1 Tax=Paracoccus sp. TaxID=267 RepID=UPI002C6A992F|nr:NIPSNAP family protein [Paracoccus sp. (in: a-proteobacteria)]HWL56579.1 NIPSNAP family protein [Paracoccus sp. (in: a-proteobacteria)]
MSYYELATLDTVIFGGGKAAPGIEAWVGAGQGRLCGAWGTDIGTLNRVFVLRAFDDLTQLYAERERALRADNPFGCAEQLVNLSMESYRALDFLPPVQPGSFGPVYEFRTYKTKVNGILPTMEKWREAVPAREAYSKLTVAMYGLDGAPRLTQIWPYESLAARSEARAKSVADGKWPPKGGPDWLSPDMTSQIAMPLPFSPLK